MSGLHKDMARGVAVLIIVAGFLLVGLIDFVTGTEIRAYPIYFLPLSYAAWRFGYPGGAVATLAATTIWVLSNRAAGMHYSMDHIWVLNALAQTVAFGTVALLLAWARRLLMREQALARADSLTGLPNARAFYDQVAVAMASCRRQQRPLTLAYIDLDNFKCVNDQHGHARGDAVLVEVADIMRSMLRATDIPARIGGDEFVLCLPETSGDQARALLMRLHAVLASRLPTEACAVSASIGALSWAVPPASVDAMIAAADQLMYQVKKNGKNRVEIVQVPEA